MTGTQPLTPWQAADRLYAARCLPQMGIRPDAPDTVLVEALVRLSPDHRPSRLPVRDEQLVHIRAILSSLEAGF
jgi:hypothetical protein